MLFENIFFFDNFKSKQNNIFDKKLHFFNKSIYMKKKIRRVDT